MAKKQYNILYIMCDQFRFDCIAALGNQKIRTPNIDRLARRGVSYTNAYSPCPVCVPARYSIRSGRESCTTGCYCNEKPMRTQGFVGEHTENWTGAYLARTLGLHGYRTFGIGKFHTFPEVYEDLGFDVHLHTEEMWDTPALRERDAFYGYLRDLHPEYMHVEQLHGERTNMYYVPQMSPMPPEHTVEGFVAKQAVEQLASTDVRPFFGFVSFIGPHPPCAPPIPYNRMYDPDDMDNPVSGDYALDHADEQIPWMNYLIYADEIQDAWARNFKSRYYAEISYIDACIGQILDAVEQRPDADDTLICFFADHGEMCGDHHAWQKECFYEASVKVPFIVSLPGVFAGNVRCDDLVSLVDLFGLATSVAGCLDIRDGIDITTHKRSELFSIYGRPGTRRWKIMVRSGSWKYIYLANGGIKQLFDLLDDPGEMRNLAEIRFDIVRELEKLIIEKCSNSPELHCMVSDGQMVSFPYKARQLVRLHQFDFSRGISDFSVPSKSRFMSKALVLEV